MRILSKHMNSKPEDFVVSPFFEDEGRVTTVHPLGGCRIGAKKSEGTVDTFGRVYDGGAADDTTDVLPGVYVVDASVVPGALGVNPTLTIVTQAVRTVENALSEMNA